MTHRAIPILLALSLLAGCVADTAPPVSEEAGPPAEEPAPTLPQGPLRTEPGQAPVLEAGWTLSFTPPVNLTPEGHGFEPSIEVTRDGLVVVTAHKGNYAIEGGRTASWLWYSGDHGATWRDLQSPLQVHERLPALEGDLATDAEGRIYFVDTYVADNTISRWAPGPQWEFTRPVQGTAGGDDRPWLAAHGDGIVYYLGNNGAGLPALAHTEGDPGEHSRIWLSVSEDGGLTWRASRAFGDALWCLPAASPADDRTLFVGCVRLQGTATYVTPLVQGYEAVVHESRDRGATWEETVLQPLPRGPTKEYPGMAVDAAGNAYFAWAEKGAAEGDPSRVWLARLATGGAWEVLDVTPLPGTIERLWLVAGSAGRVGLTFSWTADATPGAESEWFAYAMVTSDAAAERPVWSLAPVDPVPLRVGVESPGDFWQSAFDPEDVLHVAYHREAARGDYTKSPMYGFLATVHYARQAAAPHS